MDRYQTGPWLLVNNYGNQMTRQSTWKRFKTLVLKYLPGRDLSTHDGRHSFITLALYKKFPQTEIRDTVGHSSLEVTNRYAHNMKTVKRKDLLR